MDRRTFGTLAASTFGLALGRRAKAADAPAVFRVGYQKIGILVVARNRKSLEEALGGRGVSVEWVEFTAGPPLLEAMNVGSIDFGITGDTPPIFAQAAGAAITYIAALPPNGPGEGIVVKPDSPIRTVADLKGKRVGFRRGSSAQNLLVVAFEQAGVAWSDIAPLDLSPADAAAAFDRDSIDAWSIWDPFFAVAQERYDPRVLVTSAEALDANTFLLANPNFANGHPDIIRDAVAALTTTAEWAQGHKEAVAEALHAETKVDLKALQRAAARATFYVRPIDAKIVANQQATADRFSALGLIPKQIAVQEAVWKTPAS